MTYHQRRRRWLANVLACNAAACIAGLLAAPHLPNPIAVMAVVGALTASAASPYITPLPKDPEDT